MKGAYSVKFKDQHDAGFSEYYILIVRLSKKAGKGHLRKDGQPS